MQRPHPTSLNSSPHYVVIGIDFGTTFSGVAWTWSKANSPDQIEQVHKWDVDEGSARNQQADKVPSKIAYDHRGKVLKWGYMVTSKDRYQAQWFKLLLSDPARKQGGQRVRETEALLQFLHKTPVDVAADYLRCLWQHAIEVIELSLTKVAVDNMTFRVVLTLPANWDHGAQELTRKAAIQAGITADRSRGPTSFKMVTEPEAAALAAWGDSGLKWHPDFQVDDSFVVCDAGGGTVDLISYTVKSLDPLRLEMCVEPTGKNCGAVYLDERFDAAIRTHVGPSVYDKLDEEMKAKMFEDDWEYGGKRKYNGAHKMPNEFQIYIPGYKPKRSGFLGKRPSSTITLQAGHMSSIFQPVVGQIVDLVRTQVSEIKEATFKPPKSVLLVGGFGENNFLLDQLIATFSPIPIQRPNNAWGAISRGAVLKGLSTSVETETVTNVISKLSYGILHSAVFNDQYHQWQDRYICPIKGVPLARNQFTWYLRRGASVSKTQDVEYGWKKYLRKAWELDDMHGTIWVSGLKEPPSRLTGDARKLCQINYNFDSSVFYQLPEDTTADGNSKFREIAYTLNMKVEAGELDWVIYWRDQERGRAKVSVEYD